MDFLRYEIDMKHFLSGVSYSDESILPYAVNAKKYIQLHERGDVKDKSYDEILTLLTSYMDLVIMEGEAGNSEKADSYIAKAWNLCDKAREIYKNDANLHIAKMIIYNNDIVNIINHGQYVEAMSSLDSFYKYYKMKPEGDYEQLFKEFDYQILTLWIKYYALDLDGLNVIHSTLIKLYQKLDEMTWLSDITKARLTLDACYFVAYYSMETGDDAYIGIHLALKGLDSYQKYLKDSNELEDFETVIKLTKALGQLVKNSKTFEVLKVKSLEYLELAEKAILSDDIDVQIIMKEFGEVMNDALALKCDVEVDYMYKLIDKIGYAKCILTYRSHYENGIETLAPFITKSKQIVAKSDDLRVKSIISELFETYGELSFKINDMNSLNEFGYLAYQLKKQMENNNPNKKVLYENLTYLSEISQRLSHNGFTQKAKQYYEEIFSYFEAMEISKDNLINYRHYGIDLIDNVRLLMDENDDTKAMELIDKYLAFSNLYISKIAFDEMSYYHYGRCMLIKGYLLGKHDKIEEGKSCIEFALKLALDSQSKFNRHLSNVEVEGLSYYCLGLISKDEHEAKHLFEKGYHLFNKFLYYLNGNTSQNIQKYAGLCQKELMKLEFQDEA